ncbi:MAG: hypothetical protein RBS39_13100 [Phycisphaerales bacterium]|jgi:hypothetical protein|nr:hypothetical protein [Phycisphaerales bacterium]
MSSGVRAFIAETLWDLLGLPARSPRDSKARRPAQAITPPAIAPPPAVTPPPATAPIVDAPARRAPTRKPNQSARPASATMQERYDQMVRDTLHQYGVRVRKWRSGSSGVAWEVEYRDGTMARLIEAPRPRGPMSAAIFLHEIGHHAIGFHRYKPRCLEEYHAWRFALEEMERRGLNITESVRNRVHDSLHYAVSKARRRGIKRLPEELLPYVRPRARARRAAA